MKILVVDPSRTSLMILSAALKGVGHSVETFTDSAAALAHLEDDAGIEIVLTAFELSPISGIELCRRARALASSERSLHIVVISSHADPEHLAQALDAGADDFIRKDSGEVELKARLRAAERMVRLNWELRRLATTDPLTSLLNRRAFFARGQSAFAKAGPDRPLSALMVDIDFFKKINDAHGHEAGDEVLRAVSEVLFNPRDIVGRLGGEEFAVLTGMDTSDAEAFAEDVRFRVASLRVSCEDKIIAPTCSIGVSSWREGEDLGRLLKRADMALYQAKQDGRDRVVVADPDGMGDGGQSLNIVRSEPR